MVQQKWTTGKDETSASLTVPEKLAHGVAGPLNPSLERGVLVTGMRGNGGVDRWNKKKCYIYLTILVLTPIAFFCVPMTRGMSRIVIELDFSFPAPKSSTRANAAALRHQSKRSCPTALEQTQLPQSPMLLYDSSHPVPACLW